ncbi:MAG: cation-translocating P-type ATPase [Candidatus Thorarchaeota archaeon]|nr:MAG: cation-translocating P-type ATPase [Candidatus Thorarchaeota archaeon]
MLEVNETGCSTCAMHSENNDEFTKRIKLATGIFSGVMLALGIFLELLQVGLIPIYIVFLSSALSAGRYVIPMGVRGVLRHRLDQHFLMASASIGAMIIGSPAEGAAVMFLFFISILLEEGAEERVRKEIQSLVELEPPSVMVKIDGAEVCIAPTDVKTGDILIIRPGTKIGLDGVIQKGATTVNQAPITGESLPVPKSAGDQVFAGTINHEGYIEVEVTSESDETVLSKIIKLVEESRNKRAPTERMISRFSRVYTPIVLTVSILVGIVSLLLNMTIMEAAYRALTLLVVSCPCAFAVSIPVTMVSAIAGSARTGVLVKGAVHIEKASKTEIVAFDKTGTLTQGVLSVKDVCLHNNHTREEILSVAASLETMSEHPIGRAVVAASDREDLQIPSPSEFTAVPGRGVRGQIEDIDYLVGNRMLLAEYNVPLQSTSEHSCGAGSMVYVAQGSEHFGTIILSDTLRENTILAISQLKKMGIRTVMLTGDSENVAKEIAEEIGIDEYRAELMPHEKLEVVKELKESGVTLFVGDGVNDTPALVEADVGISMGAAATDAALESSDIVLMQQDLTKVPELILKARKTMSVVHQNVAASLIVKGVTGVLAVLGFLTLWMAIGIGDMGLTFAVIANALRLARKM